MYKRQIYTTIDSQSQNKAIESVNNELFSYDKRHGWREKDNYQDIFTDEQINSLNDLDISFLLNDVYFSEINFDENIIPNKLNNIFDSYPYYKTYIKAIVIKVSDNEIFALDEDFNIKKILWTNQYLWARNKISINKLGYKPDGFLDFVNFGDFVYLKINNDFYSLDQIPLAEASLISIEPNHGKVLAYIGGKNFNSSNFDRVRLSFPQSGSSFKPFVYSSSLANGYNLSSLINDAPIVFEDENLESEWRPQNYTGEFYGLLSLREALTKSVNIVSIKLLSCLLYTSDAADE